MPGGGAKAAVQKSAAAWMACAGCKPCGKNKNNLAKDIICYSNIFCKVFL